MKQQVRIIGGRFRGKKISFPNQPHLRPTSDRIRETLFNWLMHDIRDSVCLDAFAGSGALGFEAYSRGAKTVYFVENSTVTHAHLKNQIMNFNAPNLHLSKSDLLIFLKQIKDDFFDIVFYDPPFSEGAWYEAPLQQAIVRVLKPHGLLYVESPTSIQLKETEWTCLKEQKAGQVVYALYQKNPIRDLV